MRDLIEFNLLNNNYRVSRNINDVNIIVKFHPLISGTMQYCWYSIEVEIYDRQGKLLDRKLFEGWSVAFDKLTKKASTEIANYIMQKYAK